jgi:hypothetical protein
MAELTADQARFFARLWIRDLCTCTVSEIRARWEESDGGVKALAIDRLDPLGYEGRLANHNPLYYILENVFFDNHPDWLYPPLHRDIICDQIVSYLNEPVEKDDNSGILMAVQRESFKTTIDHGAVPLYFSFRRRHLFSLDSRTALIHHKDEMAAKNVKRLKRKLQKHEWLRENWGEFCPDADDKKFFTSSYFNFPNRDAADSASEYNVESFGLNSTETGGHFDLMVFSDATTEVHRKSRVIREEAVDRFEGIVTMRDTLGGKVIYDCTFWHPNDLTQRLINTEVKEQPSFKTIIVGAGGSRTGKPLTMPNRHTEKFLERRHAEITSRHGNDDFWWLQYQNEVRGSRMLAADESWVNWLGFAEVPHATWRCIFVDPAWKGSHNSGMGDSAAIAVLAFERVGSITRRYLLHLTLSNEMTSRDGVNEVFRLMTQYGTYNVAPEEHGGYVFRSALEEEANKRGSYLNIIDLKSKQTHKANRIVNFLNTVQGGHFYIVRDAPGAHAFMSQYRDYPNIDHDDAIDCVAYSADPNIMESVIPSFNPIESEWDNRDDDEPRRTRYCAL